MPNRTIIAKAAAFTNRYLGRAAGVIEGARAAKPPERSARSFVGRGPRMRWHDRFRRPPFQTRDRLRGREPARLFRAEGFQTRWGIGGQFGRRPPLPLFF